MAAPTAATGAMTMAAFAKADDLKKRIIFTIIALVIFRFGTHVPLPGIDAVAYAEIFKTYSGSVLGLADVIAGGALSRMSIFALSVFPYITASIAVQLLSFALPSMEKLRKEGAEGYKKLNQYTRYATVAVAVVQSYAIAVGLEAMTTSVGGAVTEPGLLFRLVTVITLTTSTLLLMWIGEQITSRGVGNGVSLIIFTGIVAAMPAALGQTFELGRTGAISTPFLLFLIALVVGVMVLIVFFERGQRRIPVQYPKRQVGNKIYEGQGTYLPLKVNASGVMAPILASTLLALPTTFITFNMADATGWLAGVARQLQHGQPLYMALYAGMIIFFAFFWVALQFNPKDKAEDLRKYGGFIPGIRPGANTADYLDFIMTRLTAVGAIYLALVCILPEFLIATHAVPFYFGGTSLLIVVSVVMDTITQVQSHLFAHQYEGLIKKAKLKGQL